MDIKEEDCEEREEREEEEDMKSVEKKNEVFIDFLIDCFFLFI